MTETSSTPEPDELDEMLEEEEKERGRKEPRRKGGWLNLFARVVSNDDVAIAFKDAEEEPYDGDTEFEQKVNKLLFTTTGHAKRRPEDKPNGDIAWLLALGRYYKAVGIGLEKLGMEEVERADRTRAQAKKEAERKAQEETREESPTKETYVCKVCGREFNSRHGLSGHYSGPCGKVKQAKKPQHKQAKKPAPRKRTRVRPVVIAKGNTKYPKRLKLSTEQLQAKALEIHNEEHLARGTAGRTRVRWFRSVCPFCAHGYDVVKDYNLHIQGHLLQEALRKKREAFATK